MRRERRQLEEERLMCPGRRVDEVHAAPGDHVRQVGIRAVAEPMDRPVDVHRVVVLRVPPSGDVPLVPTRRHVGPRYRGAGLQVAVEVLAHQGRAIARLLERDVEARLLVPVAVESLDPPVGAAVREDAGVVRELAGEDRRSRRAAQRVGDEVVVEGRAAQGERLHLGHEPHEIHRQIVGEHEHDVRPP